MGGQAPKDKESPQGCGKNNLANEILQVYFSMSMSTTRKQIIEQDSCFKIQLSEEHLGKVYILTF